MSRIDSALVCLEQPDILTHILLQTGAWHTRLQGFIPNMFQVGFTLDMFEVSFHGHAGIKPMSHVGGLLLPQVFFFILYNKFLA